MISKTPHLKKVLGTSFGIAILIGSTIGVGILRTPGSIAGLMDNYWLIISCWLAGGIYVLLGVGTYAELATMLPNAGGSYHYIKKAFGNYAGFLTGWFDYIANGIAPAFFCIVIGEYVTILFPVLEHLQTVIAIAFLAGFVLLHATGVKSGSFVQQATSLLKVILFVVLIVACFNYSGLHFNPLSKEPGLLKFSIVVAFFKSLQLVLGTYNGWQAGSYFAEEDKDPGKHIPKSMYTGAIITILIYTLINAAFFLVLPVSSLANTPLAASTVAQQIFGASGATIVTVIALCSVISILNAYMMIPPRILFALSRDGFFIQKGTLLTKGGTPITGLLVTAFFTLILIGIGSFEVLFSLSTFFSVIVWGGAYVALVKLRKSQPQLPRPHRSWGYPVTSVIMILFSIALLIGFATSDVKNFMIVLTVTGISYPLFLLINRTKKIL